MGHYFATVITVEVPPIANEMAGHRNMRARIASPNRKESSQRSIHLNLIKSLGLLVLAQSIDHRFCRATISTRMEIPEIRDLSKRGGGGVIVKIPKPGNRFKCDRRRDIGSSLPSKG